MQVDVVTLDIRQEVRRTLDKRYGSRPVVTEKYVKQPAPTNHSGDVLMGSTFCKVGDKYGALIVHWDTLTTSTLWPVVLFVLRVVIRARLDLAITVRSMRWSWLR